MGHFKWITLYVIIILKVYKGSHIQPYIFEPGNDARPAGQPGTCETGVNKDFRQF